MPDTPARGFTVTDLARRYRVGEEKVRTWIRKGILAAINTSDDRCCRPRFLVTPEALAAFEECRSVTPPPKPARRKRRSVEEEDFYPD